MNGLRKAFLRCGVAAAAVALPRLKPTPDTGADPFAGALTAPDLPQILRERGAL